DVRAAHELGARLCAFLGDICGGVRDLLAHAFPWNGGASAALFAADGSALSAATVAVTAFHHAGSIRYHCGADALLVQPVLEYVARQKSGNESVECDYTR